MEQEAKNTIWKDAFTPSIIYALATILISLIVYFFDLTTLSLFSGAIIKGITILINFFIILFLTKKYRDEILSGFITYGKALLFGLIIGIYSSVIISAYNYTFNTAIDSEYQQNTKDKIQEMTIDFMIEKGVPDSQIEKTIDKMNEKEMPSAIKTSLLSIPGTIIFALIISLITGAIVKREPEIFTE